MDPQLNETVSHADKSKPTMTVCHKVSPTVKCEDGCHLLSRSTSFKSNRGVKTIRKLKSEGICKHHHRFTSKLNVKGPLITITRNNEPEQNLGIENTSFNRRLYKMGKNKKE